jgi:hypothetical protein
VNELATAEVGDLDEHRKAIRVRWTVEKNDRYRHLELPDDLFAAVLATLPPREDRQLDAPLPGADRRPAADGDLEGVQGDRDAALLTARPPPPPFALQAHRSLAEVATLLGDSKRVAADHYVYALTDHTEVDLGPIRCGSAQRRHGRDGRERGGKFCRPRGPTDRGR